LFGEDQVELAVILAGYVESAIKESHAGLLRL
jgi:hypothetical protein